jgi:hypothetical protein
MAGNSCNYELEAIAKNIKMRPDFSKRIFINRVLNHRFLYLGKRPIEKTKRGIKPRPD